MSLDAAAEEALLGAVAAAFPDPPARIGVAVSGGGDSMALLHLLHRAAATTGWQVHAATVDHGLRPEAAAEAARVAGCCAALGVPHGVLRWRREERTGNLQDQARRARYRLLADWARAQGIGHVALGHTADDQAETLLMRLARGAGLDGLSGMRGEWMAEGICWHRPLLAQGRSPLREFLTHAGIDWIEDPSNEDERFARVRARKALELLVPLGLHAETLAGVARNLSEARQALDVQAAEVARDIAMDGAGDVVFDRAAWRGQGPELRRRLLVGALRFVGGGDYPPRAQAVADSAAAIEARRDATLAGCRILTDETEFRILREAAAVRDLTCATTDLWDGRWRLIGPHAADLHLGALTEEGLRQCPGWREAGLPRASLTASPAVWRGAALVAAPLAGSGEGWGAQMATPRDHFASFLLSH